MLILHGSDLQAGRPYRPDRAEAFLELARRVDPDLVVISGDLTQRAKKREYRTVRALLDRLSGAPVVVTPGNHDVPLYRVLERLFAPYRNWRRYVSEALDSTLVTTGATVVALNSSAPRTAIVGGRLSRRQLERAREAFRQGPSTGARVVVVHHHFVPTPQGDGGRPLPGARRILEAFEHMGVDLVLGGHVHQTLMGTSRALVPGPTAGIPLVTCGTTASSRGRGDEVGANSLNLVRIGPETVEVVPHRFEEDSGRFEPRAPVMLPRPARGGAPFAVESST